MWAACGRPAASCEMLTLMNPVMENDRLVVDEACGLTRTEILEGLYAELIDLLGVDAAASNRFFNQGPVSRDVIALMWLGIDELIKMVSADKLSENTYLNGWRFLDTEMRKRRVVSLGNCRFRAFIPLEFDFKSVPCRLREVFMSSDSDLFRIIILRCH